MLALKSPLRLFAVLAVAAGAALNLHAEVRLPAVFSDNMVLQQNAAVPVWGWADDGEVVTVEFRGQKVSATAQNGKWLVKLNHLKASAEPGTLTVATKTKTLTLTNVLVGEVWVCSGQSNMEFQLSGADQVAPDIAAATNSLIRLLVVPRLQTNTPQSNFKGAWTACSPATAAKFSAVGYYFGRSLQAARNVPVGLINSSVGGTLAEQWMSHEALAANPRYQTEILAPAAAEQKAHLAELAEAAKKKPVAGKKAARPAARQPKQPRQPSDLYNGMIAPLLPYAITGAIWYQGEANSKTVEQALQYRTLFPDLIRNWRKDWQQDGLTFLCVQLAPWDKFRKRTLEEITKSPEESGWGVLREAQLNATKVLPKVGIAVITDIGEKDDIHPKKKAPVGARLALAAQALAYGEKNEFSGPIYRSLKTDGGKIILSFDHVGQGLEARDGALKGFAICGADQKFVWAKAEIAGDTVVVSSPDVAQPVAVRYGWAGFPVVNLWNKDGLPASPFRTDEFPPGAEPDSK